MSFSTSTIDFDTLLVTNPNLVLRIEDDDCALLFDPDSGSVQILNQCAVEIWQRLDGRCTVREVLASLADIYDEIDAQSENEVLAVVEKLVRNGAVDPGE